MVDSQILLNNKIQKLFDEQENGNILSKNQSLFQQKDQQFQSFVQTKNQILQIQKNISELLVDIQQQFKEESPELQRVTSKKKLKQKTPKKNLQKIQFPQSVKKKSLSRVKKEYKDDFQPEVHKKYSDWKQQPVKIQNLQIKQKKKIASFYLANDPDKLSNFK